MSEQLSELKASEIDEKSVIKGFIATAEMGFSHREEILEKRQLVESKIDDLNSRLGELEDIVQRWENMCDSGTSKEAYDLEENYGTLEGVQSRHKTIEEERNQWASLLTQLDSLLAECKNFDKKLCFSNIRELLRQNPEVKIGQIEKEAGIRLGYMSRLEKEGNTSEPSVEFIVTAAKLLKVSIDTLVSINLTGLTPTEQYIVSFFDKLKADTLQDKLDWRRETDNDLNNLETDMNGQVWHPLFNEEEFYEESECEYPNLVTRIVFNSDTFGPRTYIAGDCFNLRMKNGTTLYLMDIEKSVHHVRDNSVYAKEAWMYVPHNGRQLLLTSVKETPIAPILESLFSIVKERMEHPQVSSDVMNAIDAFMKDDLGEDDDGFLF